MTIYLSRSFARSNSSFFLCSGNALQSEVLRLREDIFLMDAGLGTPRICMQDEPTGVPINRTTRFENKVGSTDVVASESLIKKHILERFFIDLVAGESLIKERAAARFKKLVGSTDVVAGEPLLLLPRRFRKNRAWMKLNQIWRKLKNPWFPGITLFRPSCFGTGKKKRFFAQLAHSAGPACIFYFAEGASDMLFFLRLLRKLSFTKKKRALFTLLYVSGRILLFSLGVSFLSYFFMNPLWEAVSQFWPPAAEGEIKEGGNPSPNPNESGDEWGVAPSSEEEMKRGDRKEKDDERRQAPTEMPFFRASSPGERVEVFEIPETPTSHSGASEIEEVSRAGPSQSETPREALERIKAWRPDKVFRPSEPEPCCPDLVEMWKGDILNSLRKYHTLGIRRGEWKEALVKLHEGRGHFDWLDNLLALEREGERCPFFLQLVEEAKKLKSRR